MENYKELRQLLINSAQTAAYSNQIIKSIDRDLLFETLEGQPVDEIIVVAYQDSETIEEYNASIGRSIERLKNALIN